jgi:predicted nucleic acid-binding protein
MTRELVIDGSITAAWLILEETTALTIDLFERVQQREITFVAPEIWHFEMLNVLRNGVIRGRLTEADALRSVDTLCRIPVTVVPRSEQDVEAILRHALRHGLTAYDATYFHLAQSRGADLLTADKDLLRLRARFPWIRGLEEFCAPA